MGETSEPSETSVCEEGRRWQKGDGVYSMVPGEEEGDWLGQRDKGKKMEVTGVFGESTGFFLFVC